MKRSDFITKSLLCGLGIGLSPGLLRHALAWSDHGAALQLFTYQRFAMGSMVDIQLVASSKSDADHTTNAIMKAFYDLEKRCSMYRADSELRKLEQKAGRPVKLSPATFEVVQNAFQAGINTDGVFDFTIEPLMRRWGFRGDQTTVVTPPTDAELQLLEQRVGFHRITLDSQTRTVEIPEGMAFDVGGIAGGIALDKAAAVLHNADVFGGFINFSGDIYAYNSMSSGQPWEVSLWDPETQGTYGNPVILQNEALSTSGAYQNRRHDASGHSWGHLLSPGLGRPEEPCTSMTIIHASATKADYGSTAMYLGWKPEPQTHGFRVIQF